MKGPLFLFCYDVTDIDRVINENSFDKIIVFCERIADKTIRDSFVENPIKKVIMFLL